MPSLSGLPGGVWLWLGIPPSAVYRSISQIAVRLRRISWYFSVPRISLILRKAYGGAYIVMDSQSIGADLTYAWPTNEIAVMGAEGAANVIFRRQIASAEDPEAMRQKMVKEYKAELMHPYYAAERGLVDDVIDPAETREVLAKSLAMLQTKHADLPSRKHGNPPQ